MLSSGQCKKQTIPTSYGRVKQMKEHENSTMTPAEELVDLLLDFIIVSANLAKKVTKAMKLKEGGN